MRTTQVAQTDALQQAIVQRLAHLSPELKRAADYILSNSDTVAMQSLRQTAKQSLIKPATFSRLARSLDFEGFEELRNLCRDEVRMRSRSFAEKASALQHSGIASDTSFLRRHAAASVENIDRLVETIDDSRLARIVETLVRARTVVLIGALSSAALIDYLGYSAQMALANWHVVMGSHRSMAMALPEIGGDDAVLVLSQQPYARTAVAAARQAKDRGAAVVAIVDSYSAPVADFANEVVFAPTASPHFFASEVSTVLFLEALLSLVVQRSGQKAQRRIAEVEQENHRSGEYWQG